MSILSKLRDFLNRPRQSLLGELLVPNPWNSAIVRSGDTLSGIAKRELGAASRWPEIYNLNRAVIGPDPDKIQPGMVLTLPRREK